MHSSLHQRRLSPYSSKQAKTRKKARYIHNSTKQYHINPKELIKKTKQPKKLTKI
jgi:hypothetical protein